MERPGGWSGNWVRDWIGNWVRGRFRDRKNVGTKGESVQVSDSGGPRSRPGKLKFGAGRKFWDFVAVGLDPEKFGGPKLGREVQNWVFGWGPRKRGFLAAKNGGEKPGISALFAHFSGKKMSKFVILGFWCLKRRLNPVLICRKIHLLKGPHGQIFPVFRPFSGFCGVQNRGPKSGFWGLGLGIYNSRIVLRHSIFLDTPRSPHFYGPGITAFLPDPDPGLTF